MADNTIRYPDFELLTDWGNFYMVGYDQLTKKEKRVSLVDLRARVHGAEFTDDQIQSWLDAGFTWLEIGVLLLQHKNLKNADGNDAFTCMKIPSEHVDEIISFIKTPQGFSMTGVALCDGEAFLDSSGSAWNLKDRFIRAYSPNLQHDGQTMVSYQIQEDAMQRITGDLNTLYMQIPRSEKTSGAFKHVVPPTAPYGVNGHSSSYDDNFVPISFDSSRVARTSSETRPKSIYIPFFQVVKKLDWTTVNYQQPSSLS